MSENRHPNQEAGNPVSFRREPAPTWQEQVPGARWFRADFHIHTVDDRAGGRAKYPPELAALPDTEERLREYARLVLTEAASRDIQILGLTPHSPYRDLDSPRSAVWSIVNEWNSGSDANGKPFRDQIYAVFPGFEPSFEQGRSGLHMIFLFDPEIGPTDYRTLFTVMMGGVTPWEDKRLRLSSLGFSDAMAKIREFRRDSGNATHWDFIVLAPHVDGDKGLLNAQKAQVLERFAHGDVASLELGDNKLPEDTVQNRLWLEPGMRKHRQAFFHSSDAYRVSDIGKRFTWLKLASPRIAALRQAMLASDSRVRLAFHRDPDGSFKPTDWSPDAERPWLRQVTVRGKASFFGKEPGTAFAFSPDLTCIIGGSMTGKSTLLDGLRVHIGAKPPETKILARQVEERGQNVFAAGVPDITLDCRYGDPTASLNDRWPAQFFTQNELQRLAEEGTALEEILGRLVPTETAAIEERRTSLKGIDEQLRRLAAELTTVSETRDAAEQALHRAEKAAELLTAFAEVGAERLGRMERLRQTWRDLGRAAAAAAETTGSARLSVDALSLPDLDSADLREVLADASQDGIAAGLAERRNAIVRSLDSAADLQQTWADDVTEIADHVGEHARRARRLVEQELAARGYDAAKLREFQDISRQAGLLESYRASFQEAQQMVAARQERFDRVRKERRALVAEQRDAFERVARVVQGEHRGRLEIARIDNGDVSELEEFLLKFRKRGITQWWNTLSGAQKRQAASRLDAFGESDLKDLGMSETVKATFMETMTAARRRELQAMRHGDQYEIRYGVGEGHFRPLPDLSGGQRVSVLLSLLLKADDPRPLVIDQPEDELDNRVLFDTVLPTLRRNKGRRQIILATHNANIVVNGDADMVILLEADARHGTVACAGAIEMPEVRDAIVRTVDGGEDAFRLRRTKYGF